MRWIKPLAVILTVCLAALCMVKADDGFSPMQGATTRNYAYGRYTAQTAANSNIVTYTVGSADATFEVSANLDVTTSTTYSFNVECAYTDESNTSRVADLTFQLLAGTSVTAIANGDGAGPRMGVPLHIRCKASTTIVLRTQAAGTYTTVTYNIDGLVRFFSDTGGGSTPLGGTASGDLSGSYPSPTVAQASNSFNLNGFISPTSLGSDQNDYTPTGLANATTLRLTSSTTVNITGLAGGVEGRIIVLHNIGSNTITLKKSSGSSSAANQFKFDADVALAADQSTTLRYDGTSSRWRTVVTGTGGGGGGSTKPTGYLQGLNWHTTGTRTVLLKSGTARDAADAATITLAANKTLTIDSVNNIGPANDGTDVLTGTGTVTLNSSSKSVTGSGTAFLSNFGTRALAAGTIGTGGSATTAIVGVGTSFLSECQVGDLIGNSSVGFSRITVMTDNTHVTVASNLTITNGATGNIVEQPTLSIESEFFHVDYITSDTALNVTVNAGSTHTGKAFTIGAEAVATWFYVYLVSDGSNVHVLGSTQYTTFLNPGSYTSLRRLGAVRWATMASGNRLWRSYSLGTATRHVFMDEDGNDTGFGHVLTNGNATTYTDVTTNMVAPRTAIALDLIITFVTGSSTGTFVDVRPRNVDYGSPPNTDSTFVVYGWTSSLTLKNSASNVACDESQIVQYKLNSSTGGNGAYLDVFGYYEAL